MNLLRGHPTSPHQAGTMLIRLMVGVVFFTEGQQKFLYPAFRRRGGAEQLRFSNAQLCGYFVRTFEMVCPDLIPVGLLSPVATGSAQPCTTLRRSEA